MKGRHYPERTCLGCGLRDNQNLLIRLAAQGDGKLELGRASKGRGGYLHRSVKCWDSFLRKKSLYRAFHMEYGREIRETMIQSLRDRYSE
ncbi:MAG: YlxR family protein [Candidatus Binatia bacterium]